VTAFGRVSDLMKISMTNEAMKLKSALPPIQYRERAVSAYLAAAVGDALGWPFEGHAKESPTVEKWDGNYVRWEKRAGTRFRPVLELVEAGAYSDDTQLILAVTRSRLQNGIEWWTSLSTCELPFWTFYERGGGGATKRAAASWLSSVPPWRAPKEDSVRKYFSAGGNGVAMRILPHCVAGMSCESFEPIARDILTDGVTTHGHPRALVGALAYGYALWYALRLNHTLGFGELITVTISNVAVWGQQQSVVERWRDWATCASRNADYASVWHATVAETLDLLKSADEAIQAGALSLDNEVLDAIGARNSKVSGAGTVSAVAAIYFSSRYAASPLEGLRRAASAVGADTDTVASMSGALLGALSDTGWLSKYVATLQDSLYIEKLARAMSTGANIKPIESKAVKKTDLVKLSSALSASISLHGVRLPNGLTVDKISAVEFGSSKNYQSYWNIVTADGLKLFVKMPRIFSLQGTVTKHLEDSQAKHVAIEEHIEEENAVVGLSLVVSNLDNSLVFYQDILGLKVSGRSGKVLRFGEHLAFKEEPKFPEGIRPVTIYLRVKRLDKLRERLVKLNYPNLSEVVDNPKRQSFTCIDPDGYAVEIINDKSVH
jgi:ADP-ribosylglycohydrolase/catechol 2,3-dioxygenase-like lactoylglutathione lyase family enzyme